MVIIPPRIIIYDSQPFRDYCSLPTHILRPRYGYFSNRCGGGGGGKLYPFLKIISRYFVLVISEKPFTGVVRFTYLPPRIRISGLRKPKNDQQIRVYMIIRRR